MSKRDSKLLLEDILVATDKIKLYTSGLAFEQFINDLDRLVLDIKDIIERL